MFFLVFSLLLNTQVLAATLSESQLKEIANSSEWQSLLHYKKGKSEVTGGHFFLSAEGKKNPLAELKATLDAVDKDLELGGLKQQALCAFKARYHFLSRKTGISWPAKKCEKWEQFIARFNNPQTVSLVFSSAYTNNPASMFGHLFLKIQSAKKNDLLDQGINFAAQVPEDENPFAFFYFGVFGGYEGHWAIQQYYEKINEYIQAENRDLWEYELNLTQEETYFFLEHLWELETTSYFAYYFFDHNCAYQMMRAIEAVRPDWDLSYHTIYAIPGELVKNLYNQEGVVREVRFRPALRKKLFQRYDVLNASEKNDFFSVIAEKTKPQQIQSAPTLEALNSYYNFQRQLEKGKLKPEQTKLWQEISAQRAQLGSVEKIQMPDIPSETRPDLGHDAYAVIPVYGIETTESVSGKNYFGVKIKSAYHDLFNKDEGYKKYSEIQFPWVEIRHRPDINNTSVEELGGVRIVSLTSISRIDFNPSWKVSMAFDSPKDLGCLNCRVFAWEGGLGVTLGFQSDRYLFYNMLTARAEFEEKLNHGYRLLPGFEAGFLSSLTENWKAGLNASYVKDTGDTRPLDEFYRYTLIQSLSLKRNLDLRQKLQWAYSQMSSRPNYAEARLDLSYYFR